MKPGDPWRGRPPDQPRCRITISRQVADLGEALPPDAPWEPFDLSTPFRVAYTRWIRTDSPGKVTDRCVGVWTEKVGGRRLSR